MMFEELFWRHSPASSCLVCPGSDRVRNILRYPLETRLFQRFKMKFTLWPPVRIFSPLNGEAGSFVCIILPCSHERCPADRRKRSLCALDGSP